MSIRKKIIFISLSILIVTLAGCSFSTSDIKDKLEIVIFKIGKADSILLRIGQQTVLIDTGEDEDGEEIVDYMKKKELMTIDYLIVTHFDKDHVGGANTILNELNVLNVITPNYESSSKEYQAYLEALADHQIAPIKLTKALSFTIGTATFTINPPRKSSYNSDNDYSLVTSVAHGKNTFLFAGDAEEERLSELINEGNLHHTFLKVPHHGRYNDQSKAFFTLVQPQYAVITSSDKNPEDKKVVAALNQLDTEVYVTRDGDIVISSDGENLSINQ